MQEESLAHTKWECTYHIVFIPKYRRKVLYGECRTEIKEIIKRLLEMYKFELVEGGCLHRPYTHQHTDTAKICGVKNYGDAKGKECDDVIRQASRMEKTHRTGQDVLGEGILCQYGRNKRIRDTAVYLES